MHQGRTPNKILLWSNRIWTNLPDGMDVCSGFERFVFLQHLQCKTVKGKEEEAWDSGVPQGEVLWAYLLALQQWLVIAKVKNSLEFLFIQVSNSEYNG